MCGRMNNKREVFDRGVRAGKRDESGKYCYCKKKEEVERNLSQKHLLNRVNSKHAR